MKLRNKVLLTIAVIWLAFLAIAYFGSETLLGRSYLQLENDRAEHDLGRITQALDQINYSLYTFTSDWSRWTDALNYVLGKNPNFVATNMILNSFIISSISMLTYWTKDQKLILGVSVDLDKKKYIPYPKGVGKYIYPGSNILDRSNVNKDLRGYILLDNGIYMLASTPITDGNGTPPSAGASVSLRYVSPTIMKKIAEITNLSVQLFTIYQIKNDPHLQQAFDAAINQKNNMYSQPISNKLLEGYTLLRDTNNTPIAMLRMVEPRSIFLTGQNSIRYFLISMVVLGLIISGILIWLLRILIVNRLEELAAGVASFGAKDNLSTRINTTGKDEISSVTMGVNKMLDLIQASHEKLENRVKERTIELQDTNEKLKQEISERKVIENELLVHKEYLAQLAHYDNLTGLPNRIFFNEMLSKAIQEADENHTQFSVMFIDLDRFKNINDALGHQIGDLVLKDVAKRFQSVIDNSTLARLGGDEFIVLTPISMKDAVIKFTEKILSTLNTPLIINDKELHVNASIGIAIYPNDGQSLEDLQKTADLAMYKAKQSGGGNYQFYTEDMYVRVNENIKIEAGLRKAIKNNEFVLYYQPKLCTRTGSLVGLEALIRWDSPEYGLISPSKFITLAEDTGLIKQIGAWVMHEACRANKRWQDEGYAPISVAVNISAKQFRHQDIPEMVANALKESQLEPQYLELEITESAVMHNRDAVAKKLKDISEMGVKVAVDDFGTGYTSMSYLKEFPVSVLKIDQTFVKGIPENQNDVSITIAVIALAHSLGMKVVAEGVETNEQLQWLADYECDIVQGYFLGRPLPENKIISQFATIDKTKL